MFACCSCVLSQCTGALNTSQTCCAGAQGTLAMAYGKALYVHTEAVEAVQQQAGATMQVHCDLLTVTCLVADVASYGQPQCHSLTCPRSEMVRVPISWVFCCPLLAPCHLPMHTADLTAKSRIKKCMPALGAGDSHSALNSGGTPLQPKQARHVPCMLCAGSRPRAGQQHRVHARMLAAADAR